jgi:hypothetical protein
MLLAESDLICIAPRIAVTGCPLTEGLHLTEPPLEITSSLVSMVWHARADRDPGHIWLRNNITRICAANPCLVPTRKQSDRSIETKLPRELPVTA